MNPNFWSGKRVLLTGHTGFKGSWLSLWLQSMGVELKGLALEPPTNPSLFVEAKVAQGMVSEFGDIRDYNRLLHSICDFKPEILIHMAAQPLVRYSYRNPIETYATNVMGTVNLLEAVRQTTATKVVINVTTDKCYENKEWVWGYRENDPIGGFDPYSSSKGCSELVTSAYRNSYFKESCVALASARAGNVIGGGDWAEDRLIPDILRAFEKHEPVVIRNPRSTRPWQHVLEPLSGYLTLAERLWKEPEAYSQGWNFGPSDKDAKPVDWIVERMAEKWGKSAAWRIDGDDNPHEANYLKLDISKARQSLKWEPKWDLDAALNKTITWHQAWRAKDNARLLCLEQIHQYTSTE
jgi:CDP-glucose 4,6-dehydratase